jgi:hypothetical protein
MNASAMQAKIRNSLLLLRDARAIARTISATMATGSITSTT